MNILVVSNYHMFDNLSSSFVFRQAAAYSRLGHRVRIIIPTAYGKRDCFGLRTWKPITLKKYEDVEFVFVRFLSLSNFGEQTFNNKSAYFTVSCLLRELLNDFSPDIIHAHALTTSIVVGGCLKKHLNIPLVVTTHGSDTSIPFRNHQFSRLKKAADHADRIVAVSSLLKKRLVEAGVQTSISVILNGFELRYVNDNDNVRPPVSLIQVGSLNERKKVDVTLHAFQHLQQKYPDATLLIVGSGPERSKLETLCQALNIRNSVHFLGQLSNKDVFTEMSKSCFFVMPSVQEGFGIVYLEAMACGCITIGTEGEGIADLITPGKNGFLVPPDDPMTIVKIIEWCIGHPDDASVIAEQGRQDSLALTWEKNAELYINLFKELIL